MNSVTLESEFIEDNPISDATHIASEDKPMRRPFSKISKYPIILEFHFNISVK